MLGLRTAQRVALRAPASFAAKRYTSGVGAKGLQGPADNAFNRERSAVKDHAAATSGKPSQDCVEDVLEGSWGEEDVR